MRGRRRRFCNGRRGRCGDGCDGTGDGQGTLHRGELFKEFQLPGSAQLIEAAQDIIDPHGVSFTHGLENQSFKNDLTVKSIPEHTTCGSQLFKEDPHHVGVGGESPQAAVVGNGFRRFVKNKFNLGEQGAKFNCPNRSQHFFKKRFKVLALAGKFCNHGDDSCWIVPEHGAYQSIQVPFIGQTEKRENLFACNRSAVAVEEKGNHLVQQGLGITHTAFGGTGNSGNRGRFNCYIFSLGDESKAFCNEFGGDGLQVKTLTP